MADKLWGRLGFSCTQMFGRFGMANLVRGSYWLELSVTNQSEYQHFWTVFVPITKGQNCEKYTQELARQFKYLGLQSWMRQRTSSRKEPTFRTSFCGPANAWPVNEIYHGPLCSPIRQMQCMRDSVTRTFFLRPSLWSILLCTCSMVFLPLRSTDTKTFTMRGTMAVWMMHYLNIASDFGGSVPPRALFRRNSGCTITTSLARNGFKNT